MVLCEFEGSIESLLVGFKVNSSFDKAILDQELSSFFRAHVLSDFDGNFSEFFLCSVSLCYTKSFFPHVLC